MEAFEKIAAFLDTFSPEDENYDYACYVKHKLAEQTDPKNLQSSLNSNEDKDIEETGELAEPDKAIENYEGSLMEPAFKDLEEDLAEKKAEEPSQVYIRDFLERLKK
jgi:hypothetical protein